MTTHLLHEGVLSNLASDPETRHVTTGLIVSTRYNPASQVSSHTSPSLGASVERPDAVWQENDPWSTVGRVHVCAVNDRIM